MPLKYSEIINNHRKYIDHLRRKNLNCKILDHYENNWIYDTDKFPKELKDKTSLATLIFLLETETHLKPQSLTKEEAKLWVDFLQHNENTQDFFSREITFNNINKEDFGTKIKISDIKDNKDKLSRLLEVISLDRKEIYNCDPYYVVASRSA